jgi:hypothetical protein
MPPKFEDFDSYYGYLVTTAREVCANAGDGARVRRYVPLTTLSTGYDSPAGAVIAASLGCRDAIALTRSQRGIPDSGVAVAEVLGLRLREFERTAHLPDADAAAAEFLSAGAHGEDYIHHVFRDLLPGKVLFTGFGGGNVWEKSMPPTEVIHRKDLSGSSLGEFRLSRDFVHLPVPCIGCLRHPDLYRISHSVEMAPYSIGGNYDKPIPRRIVESAGVRRAVFGQRKSAVSLFFYRKPALISAKGRADLQTLEKGLGLSWRERAYAALLRIRWEVGMALFHGLRRLTWLRGSRIPAVKALRPIGRAGIRILSCVVGPYEVFEHGNPQNAVLHRWALSCVRPRYAGVARRAADQAATCEPAPAARARAAP